jgi:DHA1 family inner membrane transport protein
MKNASLRANDSTALTRALIGTVIALAVGAGIITSLQPVLLGAMMAAGRLTITQLGRAATAELVGMALMATIASAWFRPRRLRLLAVFVILVAACANILTLFASGNFIIAARFLCGCSSGVLLWLFMSMTVRTTTPERVVGIYIAAVSAVAFCLVTFFAEFMIPRFGPNGGFACLLVLNAIMAVLALLVPDRLSDLPKPAVAGRVLPSGRALASLAATGAYQAGLIALWVYIVPLSARIGIPAGTISLGIDFAIIFQVVGGLSAAAVGHRASYVTVLTLCSAAALLTLAGLGHGLVTPAYLAALSVVGFIWMFGTPYAMPMIIAADPSRRCALFSTPVQLAGCALGPLAASFVVSPDSVAPALFVSGGFFAAGFLLMLAVRLRVAAVPAAVLT